MRPEVGWGRNLLCLCPPFGLLHKGLGRHSRGLALYLKTTSHLRYVVPRCIRKVTNEGCARINKKQAQRGWWKHCGSVGGVETTNQKACNDVGELHLSKPQRSRIRNRH